MFTMFDTQAMFDALVKTMPCVWRDTTIVVLDVVSVADPYRPEDCSAPEEGSAVTLERVRKVGRLVG